MYLSIYLYIHMYTHTHTHIHIHIYMYISIYLYLYLYTGLPSKARARLAPPPPAAAPPPLLSSHTGKSHIDDDQFSPTKHLPLAPLTTAAGPQRIIPARRQHYNKKGRRARRRTAPTDRVNPLLASHTGGTLYINILIERVNLIDYPDIYMYIHTPIYIYVYIDIGSTRG